MGTATLDQAVTLAVEHHQAGRLADAITLYRRVLDAVPRHAGVLQLLGVAEHQSGRHEAAVDFLQRSLAIDDQQADAHFNLGCALTALDCADEAIAAFERALDIEPKHAAAQINLGNALSRRGEYESALAYFLQAVGAAPHLAQPHFLAGNMLDKLDRPSEAAEYYRQAITIDPTYAQAHNNLGVILLDSDLDRAIEHYRQALVSQPNHDGAKQNLANALSPRGLTALEEGRYADAIMDYDAALAAKPTDGMRIRRALALPVIPQSVDQIDLHRSQLRDDLQSLRREGIQIEDPIREVDATPFYLAYHGRNDRSLLESLAALYRQASPVLTYTAKHPPQHSRLRVGFVSRNLHRHTISSFMEGWIRHLDRKRFEVVVGRLPQPTDEVSARIGRAADRVIELPNDLAHAQRIIAQQELDVLIYPDVGMEPMTYFLAFARLAPVQCAWWGHPTTTGIDTIDYYLSCDDLEPDDADSHYSETLVRLPTLAMYTAKPTLPDYAKTRRDFGFNDRGHLYLCPQSLFKLHPDFDERLGKILNTDREGHVVLFEGRKPAWTQLLRDRLTRTIPSVMDRVVFLPRQPFSAYLGLVATADVVLDTLHFNGGNTTLQALALGTPVVTEPGDMARGRISLACYRQMGMTDLVADDEQAYVDLAVRLGTDLAFQDALRAKITQTHSMLYENTTSVDELASFIERAAQRR